VIIDNSDPWGHFLHARKLIIDELLEEGQRPAQIAQTLSMDAMQVTLIAMTPVQLGPAKGKRAPNVRDGWTVEAIQKAIERAEAGSTSKPKKG